MGAYILRRLLWMIPSLLVVYTMTFLLIHATPGSPWDESEKPLPDAVKANLSKQYHLDDPLYKQYTDYLLNALRGDLGPSYRSVERSVTDIVRMALPVSIQLGVVSLIFAVAVGIPLGTIAAVKRNTWIDFVAMLVSITGIATPPFVRVTLLIVFLSIALRWFPTGGWNGLFDTRIVIPALALGTGPAALLARYTRSSLLEVLNQDYMRTARAKGLVERLVIIRHGLRNALIPVVTVAGATLANVITGAFFVETIYDVPGIGRHFVNSVTGRDYPLLLGLVMIFALMISAVNLLVDISYAFLDPRIRYQ